MKRLIPVLLILCISLCACRNNDQPATEPSESTDASVPETTEQRLEVPENLKCTFFIDDNYGVGHFLRDEAAAQLYAELWHTIPDRKASNPAYQPEGASLTLVFYVGDDYAGKWPEDAAYYGVYTVAENGVVSLTGSPFTSLMLNYKLTPELYTQVKQICGIAN